MEGQDESLYSSRRLCLWFSLLVSQLDSGKMKLWEMNNQSNVGADQIHKADASIIFHIVIEVCSLPLLDSLVMMKPKW